MRSLPYAVVMVSAVALAPMNDTEASRLFANEFDGPTPLFEIDPATGNSTLIGPINFTDVFALAFDHGGNLFGDADATNELISINTGSGNGALIAGLTVNSPSDIASRPEDDLMFLVDTGTTSLYTLDTGNGDLTLVGGYSPESNNLVGLAFSPVPLPASLSMFGAGLLALAGLRRMRRA